VIPAKKDGQRQDHAMSLAAIPPGNAPPPAVPPPGDRAAQQRGAAVPGVRTLVATVLFADIRRYTWLSHALGPVATFALIDEYCRRITACLAGERCSMDHFLGDGVMAVFGLAATAGDDADRAVRAALAIRRTVAGWNRLRVAADLPALGTGIGISTDLVALGALDMAAGRVLTCVGDGVNVAARLEKACKRYATGILITDNTRRRLTAGFLLRPIDTVILEGRGEPVELFEILDGEPSAGRSGPVERMRLTAEAVACYRQRRFGEAAALFQRLLRLDPADGFARRARQRCRRLAQQPPDPGWRPLTVLTGG
jgi:adenylate cyclase